MSSELRVRFGRLPVAMHLHGASPSPRGPRMPASPVQTALESSSGAGTATERAPSRESAGGGEWKRLEESLTALRRSVDLRLESLEHQTEAELRALEPQIVLLALAIAKKLVAGGPAGSTFDATTLVQNALARVTEGLREPRPVVVRAAPGAVAALAKVIAASDAAAPGPRTHFVADPSLGPGACEVDCDMRRVRIDLNREIARIERTLLGDATDGAAR